MIASNYAIKQAILRIQDTYGDVVSIEAKRKVLNKFGQNENVGTSAATIMQLPGTLTDETLPSTNAITTVISSSGSDTGDIYYEGHTFSGGNATFVTGTATLTGQTGATLPTAVARITRAKMLNAPAVGTISFYEGGSSTGGVPDADTGVHLRLVAGQVQSQKASTCISQFDYWLIDQFTVTVLEKTSAFAQCRIETKPITGTIWYPATEWVSAASDSGTVVVDLPEIVVVPKNHDVRLRAIGSAAGTHVAGGMSGYLALIQ